MNGYKIVLLKAILCFIGCRKVNGYAPEYVVQSRAEKKPELLQDIQEENLDIAEEGLHSLMRSKNERVRLRAVELYLRTRGRCRGYVERVERDVSGDLRVSGFEDWSEERLKNYINGKE